MTVLKKTVYIDIDIMQSICHPVALKLFDKKDDPIAKFETHRKALLESALANPAYTMGGIDLYPTFERKAAILFYSLTKNHCFDNGNKRTALATMLVFIFLNGLDLPKDQKTQEYLLDLSKRVSRSHGSNKKDIFLDEIENWLEANLRPLPPELFEELAAK